MKLDRIKLGDETDYQPARGRLSMRARRYEPRKHIDKPRPMLITGTLVCGSDVVVHINRDDAARILRHWRGQA